MNQPSLNEALEIKKVELAARNKERARELLFKMMLSLPEQVSDSPVLSSLARQGKIERRKEPR